VLFPAFPLVTLMSFFAFPLVALCFLFAFPLVPLGSLAIRFHLADLRYLNRSPTAERSAVVSISRRAILSEIEVG
jgi:hypothetical protein